MDLLEEATLSRGTADAFEMEGPTATFDAVHPLQDELRPADEANQTCRSWRL